MLLIKIHSAVEASEKRTIENSWLLRWRDKLKEAASQGDNVLDNFQQQAQDSQASSNTNNGSQQHQDEAVSSSVSATTTDVSAPSFMRNSLSDMVQGICNVSNMLFSSTNDDMERLNRTLGSLEKLSPDIGEFIRLLHLEALPKVDQTTYSTSPSTEVHGPTEKMGEMRENKRMKHSDRHTNPTLESPPKEEKPKLSPPRWGSLCSFLALERTSFPLEVLQKGTQFMLLKDRLEVAFAEICTAVKLADNHDLEDLEWLAYWAGILRGAKEQGGDFVGTTSACKTVNKEGNKVLVMECDREEELRTLVHRLEGLARDVEYFSKLVYLSPAW
uniref:Uncharacterized protein n=1 Tax=Avena sativa TaxID=4498 RepID=A0ACD5WCZ4_AVESA